MQKRVFFCFTLKYKYTNKDWMPYSKAVNTGAMNIQDATAPATMIRAFSGKATIVGAIWFLIF